MANYSREEAEKNGNAEVGAGAGLLTALAALAIGGMAHSANKSKKKEQIDRQIQEIDKEIANYRAKLFGSALYSDEISALEKKRSKLKKEREEL